MKKIAYDSIRLDEATILEDSKCCFKVRSVITKVGVYDYPDGRAFKCPKQLLKATRTARAAKIIIHDHPESMVIMSQSQMYGTVEKPFFDRDKIRAILNFDKYVTPKPYIDELRTKIVKKHPIDVSIGFYYQPDFTPGVWNGKHYDYIMKDILIDHVAAGVLKGRCGPPDCGIGVDTAFKMAQRIALDPFGDYTSMQDCINKNQEKQENPAAFCAWLHHNIIGKWPAEASSSVSNYGGKKMKKTKVDYGHAKSPEETKAEFDKCVAERMAEGAEATPPITLGQAEALCQPDTEPADEPEPSTEQLDQEETGGEPALTPFEKCVNAKKNEGMSEEDARAECRKEHPVAEEDQEDFDSCVATKMEAGLTREEAETQCRGAETDQEAEPTPLEKCIAGQKEQGKSDEEAKTWCEEELAGEHQEADALITRNRELMERKKQVDVERRRRQRRRPMR